jgi:hypothetical protein
MDSEQVTPRRQTTTAPAPARDPAHENDLHALMLAPHALIESCQAVNGEMLAFWQSRLKDGLATSARLLECTSFDSALEIQLDYAKATLQACLDQSARIAGLMMQALDGRLMLKPVTEPPNERASAMAA